MTPEDGIIVPKEVDTSQLVFEVDNGEEPHSKVHYPSYVSVDYMEWGVLRLREGELDRVEDQDEGPFGRTIDFNSKGEILGIRFYGPNPRQIDIRGLPNDPLIPPEQELAGFLRENGVKVVTSSDTPQTE